MFSLEPWIAKFLLPRYGGSCLVWGACVVFFQALLLAGYVCAQTLIERFTFPVFRWIYLALLAVPFLFFPGHPVDVPSAVYSSYLPVDIFLKLLTTIGPAFLALSMVSVTVQMWFASSFSKNKNHPYVLYAVSNAGSLAALLLYPFVFEYHFGLMDQETFWRIAYGFWVALNLLAAFVIPVGTSQKDSSAATAPRVSIGEKWNWFLPGAAGVVLMLAVTHLITVEIAPMPLLWIIPLAVYLLSFIVTFKQKPWCPAWIERHAAELTGLTFILSILIFKRTLPMALSLGLMTVLQFLLSVYCQNRLIQSRPSNHQRLPLFYTLISFGGFCGGILTAWVIPVVSNHFVELTIALLMIAAIVPSRVEAPKLSFKNAGWIVLYVVSVFLWLMIFTAGYNLIGIVILAAVTIVSFRRLKNIRGALMTGFAVLLIVFPLLDIVIDEDVLVTQKRNFYGIYRITRNEKVVKLKHGSIVHGYQLADPARTREPTAYYTAKTPVGEIFLSGKFYFPAVGAIGLGTGTMAAYLTPDQSMDFYELDPMVHTLAEEYFSYLKDSRGTVNMILGDARVSLKNNPDKKYDALIIDAFNGDAVPVHLMTVEMIREYHDHLNPDGMLLFHVSNGYIDLWPVLARVASEAGAICLVKSNAADDDLTVASVWAALVRNRAQADILRETGWSEIGMSSEVLKKKFLLWRDDYSTFLPLIKMGKVMEEFKAFDPLRCIWPERH